VEALSVVDTLILADEVFVVEFGVLNTADLVCPVDVVAEAIVS
jgi:hypothetical protein